MVIMATAPPEIQSDPQHFEIQYDRTVREEIETFRVRAGQFLAGQITEDEFRPFRLKHGIYGQRQPGVQMVRCKIPGGLLTAPQVAQLARIADEFAGGRAHLTTRQNIQYHFIPLARVAGLMHLLADVGMTNREACYNTVRNVTACPLSGIAHDEVFDVRPYAQRVAFAFLRQDLTSNLPRKFKIAFDGCRDRDCQAGAVNDIGLRAAIRDGRRGFRMSVGGGLGPLPTEAQLLDDFVPEERLLQKCEAVVRVFNQYGNRKNKNMARLKFVMRERGFAWLKEQIEREFSRILAHGGIAWPEIVPEGFGGHQSAPPPLGDGALLPVIGSPHADTAWLSTNVALQKQTGYAAVTVKVPQGNLTGDQLRALARVSSTAGDGLVRVTIEQNLLLAFIPLARLPRVHAALAEAGMADSVLAGLGPRRTVFHWHGETFDLPPGAGWLAWSEDCRHQAFRIGANAYGLQFHLEVTPGMIEDWQLQDANCGDVRELPGPLDASRGAAELADASRQVFGRWADLLRS